MRLRNRIDRLNKNVADSKRDTRMLSLRTGKVLKDHKRDCPPLLSDQRRGEIIDIVKRRTLRMNSRMKLIEGDIKLAIPALDLTDLPEPLRKRAVLHYENH